MNTRVIILFVLLLLIDVMAFQAVRQVVGTSGRTLRTVIYIAYWLVPVISVAFIIGAFAGWSDHFPQTVKVILRAMIFILYFSKLLVAVIILIDDLRRLILAD